MSEHDPLPDQRSGQRQGVLRRRRNVSQCCGQQHGAARQVASPPGQVGRLVAAIVARWGARSQVALREECV